ncbi:hypothetical protein RUND412_003605 [Rhizina undulata]
MRSLSCLALFLVAVIPRNLSTEEKKSYIGAVDCLQTKRKGIFADEIPGVVSRFEDFVYLHKVATPYVHLAGQFLPWHRYLLWVYENTLRNECNYTGAQPYWDVPRDSAALSLPSSPIWDPETGFGGDGEYIPGLINPVDPKIPPGTGGGCIKDGPFKNWTLHLGLNTTLIRDDHCLRRNMNPTVASVWMTRDQEKNILRQTNFWDMDLQLEGYPSWELLKIHGAGHNLQGGAATDIWTSTSEPLFYLLHTYLDRMWWLWQNANPERIYEVGGPIIPYSNILSPNITGMSTGNVTLDFELNMHGIAENWEVRKVMDTLGGNGALCYEYED